VPVSFFADHPPQAAQVCRVSWENTSIFVGALCFLKVLSDQ
jgi:hypothetical protein